MSADQSGRVSLSEALAELERTDPTVRAAAESFEQVKQQIIEGHPRPPAPLSGRVLLVAPRDSTRQGAVVTAPNSPSVRDPQRPVDGDHALRCGWVAGALMRAARAGDIVVTDLVELVDDEHGNHLDAVRIHARSGTYLVSIEKET